MSHPVVPDQAGGDVLPSVADQVVLHLRGDFPRRGGVHPRLQDEGVADPFRVPGRALLLGQGVHHERQVRGFPLGTEQVLLSS